MHVMTSPFMAPEPRLLFLTAPDCIFCENGSHRSHGGFLPLLRNDYRSGMCGSSSDWAMVGQPGQVALPLAGRKTTLYRAQWPSRDREALSERTQEAMNEQARQGSRLGAASYGVVRASEVRGRALRASARS